MIYCKNYNCVASFSIDTSSNVLKNVVDSGVVVSGIVKVPVYYKSKANLPGDEREPRSEDKFEVSSDVLELNWNPETPEDEEIPFTLPDYFDKLKGKKEADGTLQQVNTKIRNLIENNGSYEALLLLREEYCEYTQFTEDWCMYTIISFSNQNLNLEYQAQLPLPEQFLEAFDKIRGFTYKVNLQRVKPLENKFDYLFSFHNHNLRCDELEQLMKNFESYVDCRKKQFESLKTGDIVDKLPDSFKNIMMEANQFRQMILTHILKKLKKILKKH